VFPRSCNAATKPGNALERLYARQSVSKSRRCISSCLNASRTAGLVGETFRPCSSLRSSEMFSSTHLLEPERTVFIQTSRVPTMHLTRYDRSFRGMMFWSANPTSNQSTILKRILDKCNIDFQLRKRVREKWMRLRDLSKPILKNLGRL
jgi:hypothetical protein